MKHFKIRNILVLAAFCFALSAVPVFAADNDAVILTGTVASILELSLVEQTGYDALDLGTTAADQNVAIVTVECNDPDGYTVTMVTTNGLTGGLYEGADAENSETLAYTVKYGPSTTESLVTFTAGSGEVESTSARSTVGGDARNVLISYTAPGTPLSADTYSDTLTLTIAAK